MYELIITEKPQAAFKIATALADGKAIKENIKGVPYYKVTRGKKDLIVGCAVGHLYGLSQKEGKKKWAFPVFDIEWRPAHESRKSAAFLAFFKACKEMSIYIINLSLFSPVNVPQNPSPHPISSTFLKPQRSIRLR